MHEIWLAIICPAMTTAVLALLVGRTLYRLLFYRRYAVKIGYETLQFHYSVTADSKEHAYVKALKKFFANHPAYDYKYVKTVEIVEAND